MSIQLGAPTLGGVVNSNGGQHDLPPVTSYTTVTPGQPATSRVIDVQPVQVQQQPQQPQQVVYSEQPQSQPQHVLPVQSQPQVIESATTIVQTQPVHSNGDETMSQRSSVKFDNPHSHPDSLRAAEVRRDRAGSTATTRSTATTATTTTGTSSMGGTTGDGEDCVKEKRVKEWNKHFEVEQGEGVVCSEFFGFSRAFFRSQPGHPRTIAIAIEFM
jgi:hypothetical protein